MSNDFRSMPFVSDYRMAFQNPRTAFPDKLLKEMKAQNPTAEFAKFVDMLPHSEIAKDDFGLPHGSSGAAAIVFKATLPNGEILAFRVFTQYSPEVFERCEVISRYLDELKRRAKFPWLMRFTYFPRGIKVVANGSANKFPMLAIDWVDGLQLEKWVDLKCKEEDSAALSLACERWIELMNAMAYAGIAHGNLEHGNIMVTDQGEFRLVDYDSMCVPELVGKVNLELGQSPYQHPQRDGKTLLTPELDRFSALFIYAALRALAASPDLWLKFPQQDTLLFTADDFCKQDRSSLYQALMCSPDPEVPELTKQLFRAYGEEMSKVPAIGDALSAADN